jgi:hypothetical protein
MSWVTSLRLPSSRRRQPDAGGVGDQVVLAARPAPVDAGTEFEADVGYAALHQALLPLSGDLSALGDEQAGALRVALGFETGPAPDRLLLSSAVRMLLRRAAADTPLLLLIDDVPWPDRASAVVLGFAARRLVGSRAGLLAALRTGSADYFDVSGLPELTVRPLDDEAAVHLLTSASASSGCSPPGWRRSPPRPSACC